ncbi:hypothetical protein Tco_1193081 [Tanacetum coccineum]
MHCEEPSLSSETKHIEIKASLYNEMSMEKGTRIQVARKIHTDDNLTILPADRLVSAGRSMIHAWLLSILAGCFGCVVLLLACFPAVVDSFAGEYIHAAGVVLWCSIHLFMLHNLIVLVVSCFLLADLFLLVVSCFMLSQLVFAVLKFDIAGWLDPRATSHFFLLLGSPDHAGVTMYLLNE